MDTTLPIIALGLLVIIGSILKRIFIVKKIPDIIPLILIGIIIGPIAGLVNPSDFGIIGPIFSMMTLVIILFEGGVNLRVQEIPGTLRGATLLALFTFLTTSILSAGLFMSILGEERMTALIFGCIIGGLSPAVVLPLIRHLSIEDKTKTILTLESALADVMCIIAVISLINIYESNIFSPSNALIHLGESFFVAIGTGLVGGFLWAGFRDRMKDIESIFTIPSLVCILYGVTELLEGSGAIAVLVFGIMLGNLCFLDKIVIQGISYCPKNLLGSKDVELFNQLVDFLKTFFFIYVGISLVFVSPFIILFCIGLLFVIHLFRFPIVMATISSQVSRFDKLVVTGMIPKGLASAVLASMPVQFGIPGAAELEPVIYTIIILSIFSSTIIAYILEKRGNGEIEIEDENINFLPLLKENE